jgi:hypothetical protein
MEFPESTDTPTSASTSSPEKTAPAASAPAKNDLEEDIFPESQASPSSSAAPGGGVDEEFFVV